VDVFVIWGVCLRVNCRACQMYLGISDEEVKRNVQEYGYVCGGENDLVDGKPIGACRVSFGLHNTKQDVDEWIEFLTRYFVEEKRISSVSVGVGGMIFVSQICIYPIKSCAAVYLDSVNINKNGLEFDRKWMIVDQEGKGLT
jgi:molybdenum cofactor sulfurtransferase